MGPLDIFLSLFGTGLVGTMAWATVYAKRHGIR